MITASAPVHHLPLSPPPHYISPHAMSERASLAMDPLQTRHVFFSSSFFSSSAASPTSTTPPHTPDTANGAAPRPTQSSPGRCQSSPCPPQTSWPKAQATAIAAAPVFPSMPMPPSPPQTCYAKRYAARVSNPLSSLERPTSSSARARRRGQFLSRVRQDRDAERFETRGQQIMCSDYVAERAAWAQSMRMVADGLAEVEEAEDELEAGRDEDGGDPGLPDMDERALDEYLAQERALETALLENAPRRDCLLPGDSGSFYSDDDYETIFMDISSAGGPQTQDDMDMSA